MPTRSDNPAKAPTVELRPVSPPSHGLLFVLFAFGSFALFAPTVLLPILKEYGDLRVEERALAGHIQMLQAEQDRHRKMLDALRHDSVVNERLAMIDLGYTRPDEEVVAIPAVPPPVPTEAPPPEPRARSGLRLPDDWPAPVLRAETWAEDKGLVELFLNPTLSVVFLLMAGGLLVAAFVLFAPRLPEPPPPRDLRPAHSQSPHRSVPSHSSI